VTADGGDIVGPVTPDLEAVVPCRLCGSGEESLEVETVVDTGFTGSLLLPREIVGSLRMPLVGQQTGELADGSWSTSTSDVCTGSERRVTWRSWPATAGRCSAWDSSRGAA
jgi:hypothetical protein